jgi:hypothetical protein
MLTVGASLLAMDVNDDAGNLNARIVWKSIVGTPPGASSLLQEIDAKKCPARGGAFPRFIASIPTGIQPHIQKCPTSIKEASDFSSTSPLLTCVLSL